MKPTAVISVPILGGRQVHHPFFVRCIVNAEFFLCQCECISRSHDHVAEDKGYLYGHERRIA
jgi:hypothetical protein